MHTQVFGIFAFSKRKGDTVFDMTVQTGLVHIMRTGTVPAGSRTEWFWREERLVDSNKFPPLSPGLQDVTTAVPLHSSLRRIVDKRDRCTGQYIVRSECTQDINHVPQDINIPRHQSNAPKTYRYLGYISWATFFISWDTF